MKAQRILLLITLFLGLALSANAGDDTTGDNSTPPQPIKKVPLPGSPHKAKAPSLVMILFSYDSAAETAHFDLPAYIDYIDITLQSTEDALTFFGTVPAYDPEWYQPLPAGEYIITCTADNGDIYQGYVNI